MKTRQPIFYTTHNLAVGAAYVIHPKVLKECMPESIGVPFLFYVGLGNTQKAYQPAHTISQQVMGLGRRKKDGTPYIDPDKFERESSSLGIIKKEGDFYPLMHPFVGNKNDLGLLLREYGQLKEGEEWAIKLEEIKIGDKTYPHNRVANPFVPFSAGAGYESSCISYVLSGGKSIQNRENYARLKEYLHNHKEELTRPLTKKEIKQITMPETTNRRGLLARIFG